MSMNVQEFFHDLEKQMKDTYWKKFFKIFMYSFIWGNIVIFLFLAFILRGNFEPPKETPNLFVGMGAVVVSSFLVVSLIQAYLTTRDRVIRGLNIHKDFENINLYDALTYLVKKENPELTDEQLKVMVQQYYEKYRLKEIEKLTLITSDEEKMKKSEGDKLKVSESYFAKEKQINVKELIWKYY